MDLVETWYLDEDGEPSKVLQGSWRVSLYRHVELAKTNEDTVAETYKLVKTYSFSVQRCETGRCVTRYDNPATDAMCGFSTAFEEWHDIGDPRGEWSEYRRALDAALAELVRCAAS